MNCSSIIRTRNRKEVAKEARKKMERASGIKRWSRTKAEEQTAALVRT